MLDVTAGVRYSDQSTSSGGGGSVNMTAVGGPVANPISPIKFGAHERNLTPRAVLTLNIDDNKMLYASVSKGFRAGGPSNVTDNAFEPPGCTEAFAKLGILTVADAKDYKSDSIWNYEIGLKATTEDGNLRANLSAYYIDWNGMQSSVALANLDSRCAGLITQNNGRATVQGFEIDVQALPFDDTPFTIHATLGYNKARLVDAGASIAKDGALIPLSPDWKAGLSGEYEFTVNSDYSGFFRVGGNYQSSQVHLILNQDTPFYQIPPQLLLNANLTVFNQTSGWDVTLYGTNLTDELQIYGSQGLFGAETTVRQTAVGRPRTVGIRFGKDF